SVSRAAARITIKTSARLSTSFGYVALHITEFGLTCTATAERQGGHVFSKSPNCARMGGCFQPIPSDRGAHHDPTSPAHERGHAGAQSFAQYPALVSAAGVAVCASLQQVAGLARPRGHSNLSGLSGQREEAVAMFDPHRHYGAALPLQCHAREALSAGRDPAASEEAAEAADHPQPG